MKKLIIVSGTMGVGKTSVCKHLYKMAPKTAWLDGDWCWLMHPWDNCPENRAMAMSNITTVLRAYLMNSTLDNVVFSWVLHKKEIIEELLKRLEGTDFKLHAFALICSPGELRARMTRDGRERDSIEASVERLQLYSDIGWRTIDTTSVGAQQIAETIAQSCGMMD